MLFATGTAFSASCLDDIGVIIQQDASDPCCAYVRITNTTCPGVTCILGKTVDGQDISSGIFGYKMHWPFFDLIKVCTEPSTQSVDVYVKLKIGTTEERIVRKTVELPGCDVCKCDQSWMKLTFSKDNALCPDGCMIKVTLDIPDDVDCYDFLKLSDGTKPLVTTGVPSNKHFEFSFCSSDSPNQFPETPISIELTGRHGVPPCQISQFPSRNACNWLKTPSEGIEPCKPDCEDSEWVRGEPIHFGVADCPLCEITVEYVTRKACDPIKFHDVQITKMRMSDRILCANCLGGNPKVMNAALAAIIQKNKMGFPPNTEEGCDTTWRVSMASCWSRWSYFVYSGNEGDITVVDTVDVHEPCADGACCSQPITVCRKADGSKSFFIHRDYPMPNVTCPDYVGGPEPNTLLPCWPSCEDLAGIGIETTKDMFSLGPMTALPDDPNQVFLPPWPKNTMINLDNMHGINVSHDNEQITIRLRSKGQSATISLFDVTGNRIITQTHDLTSGTNEFPISLEALQTGVYLYVISIDNLKLKTGKLSIIR